MAAAHRILTNSFGLIPFGLYRKEGEARVAVDDSRAEPGAESAAQRLHVPLYAAEGRHVQRLLARLRGGVEPAGAGRPGGRSASPCPRDCCTIRKDQETGRYWYDYSVDGVRRTFTNYELSFLYFETYDGIRGRGLLDLAREAIAVDAMAQRYGKKFYQNGARLSGIVEVDSDCQPGDPSEGEIAVRRPTPTDDAFAVAVLDHGHEVHPAGRQPERCPVHREPGASAWRRSAASPASQSTCSRRARRAMTATPSSGSTM